MANNLFREKSLNKVSTPEQLDDYIKVANPGVWVILFAIMSLLLGLCVWAVFGRVDKVEPGTDGSLQTQTVAPVTFVTN